MIFMKVKFLPYKCCRGIDNMALDERMLNDAIKEEHNYGTARFYSWSPKCISLGKSQKNIEFEKFDIDVVYRVTGGRALLHDKELTYCFVGPLDETKSIIESYKNISNALILGFKKLGIELDYASNRSKNLKYCMNISCGADVSYMGKKLIGSAQFRSRGYVLQHGSILFDADFSLIEKIFGQKVERDNIITMKEINPDITKEDLIKALEYGFEENFKHQNLV